VYQLQIYQIFEAILNRRERRAAPIQTTTESTEET